MSLSRSSVVFAVIALAGTVVAQVDFANGQYRDFILDPIPAVTQTVTFTVFGPVNTKTERQVVTRTQMYNGGITSDVRIPDTTSLTKTFYNTKTEWLVEGGQTGTTTTVTAGSIYEELGGTEESNPNYLTSTARPTRTEVSYVTIPTVATHTFFEKSTKQEVSVIYVHMTTTLYQTVTRTHVAVASQVVTSTRAGSPIQQAGGY